MQKAIAAAEDARKTTANAREEASAAQQRLRGNAKSAQALARADARKRVETVWHTNANSSAASVRSGGGSVEALVHTQAKLSVSEEALKKARQEARSLRARLMDLRRDADNQHRGHQITVSRASSDAHTTPSRERQVITKVSKTPTGQHRPGVAASSAPDSAPPLLNRHARRQSSTPAASDTLSSSATTTPNRSFAPRPRECKILAS
jgi:hypothetical protein